MLEVVLAKYPTSCQPVSYQFLGNAGGFSGARFWKLETPGGTCCLRRWPMQHPSPKKLAWIHDVLVRASACNCSFLPVPIPNKAAERFTQLDGYLWELSPWMPGEPDLRIQPTGSKLAAAMKALAQFHVATKSESDLGPSPGLAQRHELASQLVSGELDQWRSELPLHRNSPFYEPCRNILELAGPLVHALPQDLASTLARQYPLQPCIRDIWYDHILFTNCEVTGMIDFGAMRMETRSADIARLIGSVAGRLPDAWQTGLAAYEQVSALSWQEKQAVESFDRSNLALSGLNWLRWLMFEPRSFENTEGVYSRLHEILQRLG